MVPSMYKYFAITLLFFTLPLWTLSEEDYFSQLTAAISDNDINTVHQLLLQNSTDWLTDNRGWEIARIAAEKGNLLVILYIAEHEWSILEKKNEENETIGHIAAKNGHPKITEYFLRKIKPYWKNGSERGSLLDLAAKTGDLNCISRINVSPYDPSEPKRIAMIAVQNGHLDVSCYMALNTHNAYCREFKAILLTIIKNSRRGNPKIFELLGKLTDKWEPDNYCPDIVELASSEKNTELLRYLAEKKCTHFLKCEYPYESCRPMEIAFEQNLVNQNFLDCLERVSGTTLRYIGKSKLTIGHLAAEHKRLDVIQCLAEKNASILDRVDRHGKTVVDIAAQEGYVGIVRYAVRRKPLTTVLKTWGKITDSERHPYFYPWNRRYSTAFHLAMAKNFMDMDTLKYVVEKGGTDLITRADPGDNETVAHSAARIANMEILQYLVEKKPSVLSMSDSWGDTVLHILAQKNELNGTWLTFFVDRGAPLAVKNGNQDTVGHILAKNGHTYFVKYLVQEDPSILTIVDQSGDTILHILARKNVLSVKNLSFSVDKGVSLLAYNNQKENIPLIASKNGNLEIVRFVAEKEGSVFEGNASVGIEMAETAASHGHSNILKFIVDKKPILLSDRPSILFKLSKVSEVLDMLRYLRAACKVKITNSDRRTFENKVFSEALEYDYPDILDFMKYDVNMMNDKGEPLIFTAVRRKRPNIFYYLADNRRTNLTALDREGNNILFIAVMNRDLKKMQYILDAVKAPIDIEWRNQEGNSLLHVAVHEASSQGDEMHASREESAAHSTRNDIDVIRYLVEEKYAHTDTSGHENMTALHYATRHGNQFISNYLLDHGANPKLRDAKGSNFWQVMHFPTPESASVGTSTRDDLYDERYER